MKKQLTVLCLAAAFSAPAQTLFSYGGETVSATAFLQAYQKTRQGPATEKSLNEYRDLFIASRLKIKEAKALGYDTLPQLIADLANLRQQIIPAYLNDKESMDKMVGEAFSRSQKDLHLAHIFIKAGDNAAATEQKKTAVLQAVSKGDFAAAAKQYSDDPSAKSNGGDLGWITVFSLPYELENLAYNTAVGKISAPYKSAAGYHIFKNLGSRKAIGRIKASQILLAIPPNSTEAGKAVLKQRADSLYKRLQAGADFGKLAAAFSNDVVSAASNGQMAEFGVGDYHPVFEAAVLGLAKNGAVGKPFLTGHGYHIVKRLNVTPVSTVLNSATKESLRMQVEQSDRTRLFRAALAQKAMSSPRFKKLPFSGAELQAYTDSVLSYQVPAVRITLHPTTALLQTGKHAATVSDWMTFAQAARLNPQGGGLKPFEQLWNEFVQATAVTYYQDHLEEFNEEFRRQITEFAEGNLFFEIMQRQVWTPAQTDSAALVAYFEKHKEDYNWKESADAILFYGVDAKAAKEFYNALHKKPSNWRTVLLNFSEQITADSNRFELAQLPSGNKGTLAKGMLTTPVVNKEGNTASFAYVLQLYTKPSPRNFDQAKGLVITDYQAQLERDWVEKLRKKYPVTIDEKVWTEVVKKAGVR